MCNCSNIILSIQIRRIVVGRETRRSKINRLVSNLDIYQSRIRHFGVHRISKSQKEQNPHPVNKDRLQSIGVNR